MRSLASRRSSRLIRRGTVSLAAGVLVALSAGASNATAYYNVCGSSTPGYQGGGGYCNLGFSLPIDNITEGAGDGSIAVYRATAGYLGAPSASGTEYWSGSTSFTQQFHCYSGYAAEHNRHSYSVYVYWVQTTPCA